MSVEVKIDTRAFDAALLRFGVESKKSSARILREQGSLFVRDVLAITPPAGNGKKGAAATAAGKGRIAGDLRRIFKPMSDDGISAFRDFYGDGGNTAGFSHKGASVIGNVTEKILGFSQMAAWHLARRKKNGQVVNVHRAVTTGLKVKDLKGLDIGIVRRQDFQKYLKLVQSQVGLLASGWNAAAAALGRSVPVWVSRHGSSRGQCEVRASGPTLKIRISNSVKFATNVRGLPLRVQAALDNRGTQMLKQLDDFAIKRAATAAGFK